eukprot:CAMPEP_0181322812 /NCGR_PEP_ID=MMETSP1101-20121128/19433_1 /TAXON_ID=46948 /ORGANISM="Rhodomonas abbreviata, Strain Caron Lab Isolate" /LENGTH=221 /DNA_ID=CAMNT_0023430761 /DNA_START=14 /DNA_END=679 /DNA_ORIENTATION=+
MNDPPGSYEAYYYNSNPLYPGWPADAPQMISPAQYPGYYNPNPGGGSYWCGPEGLWYICEDLSTKKHLTEFERLLKKRQGDRERAKKYRERKKLLKAVDKIPPHFRYMLKEIYKQKRVNQEKLWEIWSTSVQSTSKNPRKGGWVQSKNPVVPTNGDMVYLKGFKKHFKVTNVQVFKNYQEWVDFPLSGTGLESKEELEKMDGFSEDNFNLEHVYCFIPVLE